MAVAINAAKLRVHHSNVKGHYAHLKEEQELLQRELTANFPSKTDILFDKDLMFMMLNG